MTTAMKPHLWRDMQDELDLWQSAGRTATLWWRDDDAVKPGPLLNRLAETAMGAPLSLAVIPARVDPALQRTLTEHPALSVIQHGYAHENHALFGAKKCEFPENRDAQTMLEDLATGRERLTSLFENRFRPALAPPWNRIADTLPARLEEAGLKGLSTFRRSDRPAASCRWIDTHCDIIAWRGNRGFVGEADALGQIIRHLRARRTGEAIEEPTGVMSHHIVHDEECWRFLRTLVSYVMNHPAAAWCDPFSDLTVS